MSTRHYEAILRLRSNPDFKEVIEWIEREREKVKESLTSANASVIQQLQGHAQAYGKILDAVDDAQDILSRTPKNTPSAHF